MEYKLKVTRKLFFKVKYHCQVDSAGRTTQVKHCYMVISTIVEISHVHSAQIGTCTYPRYHHLVSRLAAPHHATQFRYPVKMQKNSATTNCDISRKQSNIPHSHSECCKLYKGNPSNYQLIILTSKLSLYTDGSERNLYIFCALCPKYHCRIILGLGLIEIIPDHFNVWQTETYTVRIILTGQSITYVVKAITAVTAN